MDFRGRVRTNAEGLKTTGIGPTQSGKKKARNCSRARKLDGRGREQARAVGTGGESPINRSGAMRTGKIHKTKIRTFVLPTAIRSK